MGSEFKDREARKKCYSSRDSYFECMEQNSPDKVETCLNLLKAFEGSCGQKWTEHFLRKRDYMKFREKVEKAGVESIDNERIQKSNNNNNNFNKNK